MLGPYERALRKYGREPGEYFRNVIRNCYVGETKEQVWRDYAPHALAQMRGYLPKYTEAGIFETMAGEMFGRLPLPSAEELPGLAESGEVHFLGKPFVVGTPDEVCRAVEEDERSGDHAFPGVDADRGDGCEEDEELDEVVCAGGYAAFPGVRDVV